MNPIFYIVFLLLTGLAVERKVGLSVLIRKGVKLMKYLHGKATEAVGAAPAAQEAPEAAHVQVGQDGPEEVTVTFTIRLKEYTEAEAAGAVATCFLTGEPIKKLKNANEIHSPERPEFDGKVVSTRVLNAIVEAVEEAKEEALLNEQ